MLLSIFNEEFGIEDIYQVLPLAKKMGMDCIDFRFWVNGKDIAFQTMDELRTLKKKCDEIGLKVAVLQSSLCKVNMPDTERQKFEEDKLEGYIRAAEVLDCPNIRSFNYWQHDGGDPELGQLAKQPKLLEQVMEKFYPIAKRAKEAGLRMSFENCGQTIDEIAVLLKELNVPDWGLAFDPRKGHDGNDLMPATAEEIEAYCDKGMKYANHLHVKAQSVLTGLPQSVIVPWERLLCEASKGDRIKVVSLEVGGGRGNTMPREEICRKTIDAIKALWPANA